MEPECELADCREFTGKSSRRGLKDLASSLGAQLERTRVQQQEELKYPSVEASIAWEVTGKGKSWKD